MAALLPGCAIFGRYDVARIHRDAALRPRNPVIVIPGLMGSRLHDAASGTSSWGRFSNVFRRGKDGLALPIDRLPLRDNRDGLEANGVIESAAGVKFYGAVLDVLRRAGGYRIGDIDDPRPGDNCFVFDYDWRRDGVEGVLGLGRAIERIRTGLHAPDLRFDIVAHSMGGMIAEYYLRYGPRDLPAGGTPPPVTWAGARDLGRLVLIGTPRRGSMSAFRILHAGLSRSLSPAVLFTMPSLYQLLPQDGGRFLDPLGQPLPIDLHDPHAWMRNGWSAFNPRLKPGWEPAVMLRYLDAALHRARAFRAALDRNAGPAPVPVHLFGSDCVPTLNRVFLVETPRGPEVRFDGGSIPSMGPQSAEALLMAPGDGSVTAESLLGFAADDTPHAPGTAHHHEGAVSAFFICETHGLLVANPAFQDNLFYVLLSGPRRAPDAVHAASGD